MRYKGRQYRWFHNRIGKKIYSPLYKNGIVVKDRDHAFELWTLETFWYDEKEFLKHEKSH